MAQGETRDPKVREAFAARLRELRHAFGAAQGAPALPQAAFARALGLESERYRRYERGELEPPLGVLALMRRITGVSLDMLIAGEAPGDGLMVAPRGMHEGELLLADRLRMAREIVEPALAKAAAAMGVPPDQWMAWEAGATRPPIGKMEEFAHRFGVGLDYLYQGVLSGVAHAMVVELTRRHPSLLPPESPAPKGVGGAGRSKDTARGSKARRAVC